MNARKSAAASVNLLGQSWQEARPTAKVTSPRFIRRAIIVFAVVGTLAGFSLPASSQCAGDGKLQAGELLRRVVAGELKAQNDDHSRWMHEVREGGSGKEQVKLVVQTEEGELERLEVVKGQPLTAEQQRQEDNRIQELVHHPGEQSKNRRAQEEDAGRTEHLMKMLPDAVTAKYEKCDSDLVELLFVPNPIFHPSSHEASVFHSMEGRIWVNQRASRIAEIQGRLMNDVKFAGGLLGHLDKGGEFHVKQSEVAPGHWEITLLHVNMRGKALFFKTISVQQDEVSSNFRRVPDNLTMTQAAEELRRLATTAGHPGSVASCFVCSESGARSAP